MWVEQQEWVHKALRMYIELDPDNEAGDASNDERASNKDGHFPKRELMPWWPRGCELGR